MRKIKDGIVFSNDIKRILSGKNALGFDYSKKGIVIPKDNTIDVLRDSFKKDVDKIFDGKSTIISEEEMLVDMYESILDVYRRYPHCFIR